MSCKKWQSFNRNNQVRPLSQFYVWFFLASLLTKQRPQGEILFSVASNEGLFGRLRAPFTDLILDSCHFRNFRILNRNDQLRKFDRKNIMLMTKLSSTISERQDCWFKRDSRQKVAQVCQSCWTSFHQPGEFVEIRFRGVATSKEGPQIGPNQKPQPRPVERNEGAN